MRGCLGMVTCVAAVVWIGLARVPQVAYADGGFVTPDSVMAELAAEVVEVAGEQVPGEVVTVLAVAQAPEAIDVRGLIVDAARRWGVDESTLLRIAWCESRFDPEARGPAGLAGVFQFAPITWGWVAEKAGYPGASPYDANANVEAAAYLYKTEGPKHWGCK